MFNVGINCPFVLFSSMYVFCGATCVFSHLNQSVQSSQSPVTLLLISIYVDAVTPCACLISVRQTKTLL